MAGITIGSVASATIGQRDQTNQQRKEKEAVPLGSILPPRFDDRAAIFYDAIRENKSAPRAEPQKHDDKRHDQQSQDHDEWDHPNRPCASVRLVRRMTVEMRLPIAIPESAWIKVEVHPAGKICEKGGETDDEPFPDIERLKENFLRQLEGFAEGLENLDLLFGLGHHCI